MPARPLQRKDCTPCGILFQKMLLKTSFPIHIEELCMLLLIRAVHIKIEHTLSLLCSSWSTCSSKHPASLHCPLADGLPHAKPCAAPQQAQPVTQGKQTPPVWVARLYLFYPKNSLKPCHAQSTSGAWSSLKLGALKYFLEGKKKKKTTNCDQEL